MKTKFLIIASALLLALTSCKNDKKTDLETDKPAAKENFSVEIDAVAAKKDDFCLYYTEDNTITFSGEKAVWRGVKGGNVDEKVVLNLSEEIIPTDIRLDFGINKEQDSVHIKNVKISYYGKDINIKGSELFNWFINNPEFKSEVDVANGITKFLKSGTEYKTPYLYPKQELIDALKKLTSETK